LRYAALRGPRAVDATDDEKRGGGVDRNKVQQFMLKVIGDVGASVTAGLVFIGTRVGLFQALAGAGSLRLDQVVARAGLQARYVEEWLAGRVASGY
jgi:hypothetical protein